MQTLLLDRTSWDLVLDQNRNIAVASDPYSVIQDVCTAIRMFAGECWYDTTIGVGYLTGVMGTAQPVGIFATQAEAAALTVPEVVKAKCSLAQVGASRNLTGYVLITLESGETLSVGIN